MYHVFVMVIPKIVEFATAQLRQGKTVEDVSEQLYKVGWNAQDVQDSMLDALKVVTKKPKKSKKWLSVLLVLFLLFGMGSVGAYYYVQYMPEAILEKATFAMADIDSLEYSISSEATLSGIQQSLSLATGDTTGEETPDSINSIMLFTGAYDISDAENPSIKFDFTGSSEEGTYGSNEKIKVSALYTDQKGYVNVTSIPDIALIDDISLFTNKWIEVDYPVGELQLETLTNSNYSLQEKVFIRQAAVSTGFVSLKRESSSALINETPVHTISYTIDISKYPDFYNKLRENMTELRELTDSDIEGIRSISEYLAAPISGKFYIGQEDFYVYKYTINISVEDPESEMTADATIELSMKSHNTNIDFEIPAETISYEEIQEDIQNQIMQNAIESSIDLTTIDGREAFRRYSVTAILNALRMYAVENGIEELSIPACTEETIEIGTAQNNLNLKAILVPDYIQQIPTDPVSGTEDNTGYAVCIKTVDDKELIKVSALHQESDVDVAVQSAY